MKAEQIIEEARHMAGKYESEWPWYCGFRAALYELLAWCEDQRIGNKAAGTPPPEGEREFTGLPTESLQSKVFEGTKNRVIKSPEGD